MAWYDGMYKTVQKFAWPTAIIAGMWMGFGTIRGCAEKERIHLSGAGPRGKYEIDASGLKETNPVFARPEFQDPKAPAAKSMESEVEGLQGIVSGTSQSNAPAQSFGVNNGVNTNNGSTTVNNYNYAPAAKADKPGIAHSAPEQASQKDGYKLAVPLPDGLIKRYVVEDPEFGEQCRAWESGQGLQNQALARGLSAIADENGYITKAVSREYVLPPKEKPKPFVILPKRK